MNCTSVKTSMMLSLLLLGGPGPVLADAFPSEQVDLWRDAEKKDLKAATQKAKGWRDENMPHAKIRMKEYCTHWTGCEGKERVTYELAVSGFRQSLECPTQEGRCVVLGSDTARPAGSV